MLCGKLTTGRSDQEVVGVRAIEIDQSDYESPMIFVKAPVKDFCLCTAYRLLNAKTMMDFSPLRDIKDVVENINVASFIFLLDLAKR